MLAGSSLPQPAKPGQALDVGRGHCQQDRIQQRTIPQRGGAGCAERQLAQHRLQIDHGRAVHRLEIGYSNLWSLNLDNLDWVQADRVQAVGRARVEDALFGVCWSTVDGPSAHPARAVEPGEHEHPIARPQPVQSGEHAWLEDEPGVDLLHAPASVPSPDRSATIPRRPPAEARNECSAYWGCIQPRRRLSAAAPEAHQVLTVAAPRHAHRQHRPDPAGVELVLERLRAERVHFLVISTFGK